MHQDCVSNYVAAIELIHRLREESSSAVYPVRRIMMHAEEYVERQFTEYFKVD